jgi:hypothetical protein
VAGADGGGEGGGMRRKSAARGQKSEVREI